MGLVMPRRETLVFFPLTWHLPLLAGSIVDPGIWTTQ